MNRLDLKGIDGTNPLGFLAAMGAFRVASVEDSQTRMAWQVDAAAPYPMLQTALTADGFAKAVCAEAQRVASEVASYNPIIKVPAEKYRSVAQKHIPETGLPATPTDADYFAAFASDGVVDKEDNVKPTRFSFSNGGSGQLLLKNYKALAYKCDQNLVLKAFFHGNKTLLKTTNLNWEPSANRSYALRWNDPANIKSSPKMTNVPLNVMAFLGLACFPCFPGGKNTLRTTSIFSNESRRNDFIWCLWKEATLLYTACSLLRTKEHPFFNTNWYRSTILEVGGSTTKRFYFSPATPL